MWTSGQIKGRSLTYTQNKIGPRIDPCGTPMVKSEKDEHVPLILVHCFPEFRYDSIYVSAIVIFLLSFLLCIQTFVFLATNVKLWSNSPASKLNDLVILSGLLLNVRSVWVCGDANWALDYLAEVKPNCYVLKLFPIWLLCPVNISIPNQN